MLYGNVVGKLDVFTEQRRFQINDKKKKNKIENSIVQSSASSFNFERLRKINLARRRGYILMNGTLMENYKHLNVRIATK